jgi:hypothetical protein
MRTCFVFGVVVLASCDLYFGHPVPDALPLGGGGGNWCEDAGGGGVGGGGGGGGGGIDRDPTTGDCLSGPCVPPPEPTYASCVGPCEGLAETACLSTPGCHPTYTEMDVIDGLPPPRFNACWDIAPLPVTEGSAACAQADAQACSTRDDCASLMAPVSPQDQFDVMFAACQRKPAYTCPSACQSPGVDQQECNIICDAHDCFATCLPSAATGTCNGSAVTCGSAAPDCPIGTSAGVVAGCWTGYCIPQQQCQ